MALHVQKKAVLVQGLTKRYGDAYAVRDVSFAAQAGKLTTLLGPSGCGKTTTLRAIGGFITVDDGSILIGDQPVDRLPPYRRPTRTVFQSYALFPHMTVWENVAFGLKATRVPRRDIPGRVSEALRMVGLEAFAQRASGQLSGGQQQRVAFARALVTEPEVLLLDEPLSNLDAKLRVQMRLEIRRLQQEVGITTIYVTHDQEEAMSLSDHVIVMNAGSIEQQGAPYDIYEQPVNRFVADFIGTSNLLSAAVDSVDAQSVTATVLATPITLPAAAARFPVEPGARGWLVVRPEHVRILIGADANGRSVDAEGSGRYSTPVEAMVTACDYRGSAADYVLEPTAGGSLTAEIASPRGAQLIAVGTSVRLQFDLSRVGLIAAQ